ncbi:MAG: helix-turn-helix transcriptional regulator, partial [Thiomonas delicata]
PAVLATLRAEIDDGSPAVPGFAQAVVTDPALFDLLRGLHARLHDAADPLLREGLWTAAFGALLRRHGQTRARPPQGDASAAVAKAQALLRERCAEALSLRDLADAVGLSPWHLNRAFRQKVGLPPHAWRNQWRLAQAKQRLRAGLAPAVVAAELGFADQAHFSRHFKRAFGVSPGRYPASR